MLSALPHTWREDRNPSCPCSLCRRRCSSSSSRASSFSRPSASQCQQLRDDYGTQKARLFHQFKALHLGIKRSSFMIQSPHNLHLAPCGRHVGVGEVSHCPDSDLNKKNNLTNFLGPDLDVKKYRICIKA